VSELPRGRLQRQTLDARYYDALWNKQLTYADLILPSEEELARQDLGHLLAYTWMLLGDLSKARVLELGCGSGDQAVLLARRGAGVTAIDISKHAGRLTRARSEANNVADRVHFCQMNAETPALANGSFDLIAGFGALHHLDLQAIAPEMQRLLKPGGRAIFCEPLGENPLLEWARSHLPYRNKARSPNEAPMTYKMIATVGAHFRRTQVREMYLLSMIGRAMGTETTWAWLWRFDEWILHRLPTLRRFCRYAVIVYHA